MMTGVRGRSASPKPSFQFILRELHDRRTAMHVVGGEGGREQPGQELARLFGLETLPSLDGGAARERRCEPLQPVGDRKSTRLNSSHLVISYAVFCLKKKKTMKNTPHSIHTHTKH